MTKQIKVSNELHEALTKLKEEVSANTYGELIDGLIRLYKEVDVEHPEMLE